MRFDGREAFLSSETATPARLAAAERVVEGVDGRALGDRRARPGCRPAGDEHAAPRRRPRRPTPTPGPETVQLLTGTAVMFGLDSVALSDAALTQLSQIAAALEEYPALTLTVTGHIAIPTGTAAEAIAFSEPRPGGRRRARAPRRPAVPSRVVGAGASDPVGDNATAEGAALNRRVTFAIQEDS